MTKSCQDCQRSKITRHTKSPIGTFPLSSRRFAEVHLDIVGPFPLSDGHRYILTCIDRFTRWMEAIPMPNITAETVSQSFLNGWVSRFGSPDIVHTDRGRQFTSNTFRNLLKLLGTRLKHSTSYHPQSNGLVERLHRTLKSALICHNKTQWTRSLPLVLLGLRTSVKDTINCSPVEMVYGETLHVPGQMFTESNVVLDSDDFLLHLQTLMSRIKPATTSNKSSSNIFINKELNVCSHVWIRNDRVLKPLEQKFHGPYRVIKRFPKYFTLQIGSKTDNITIDRLKPAFTEIEHSEIDLSQEITPIKSKEKSVSFSLGRG